MSEIHKTIRRKFHDSIEHIMWYSSTANGYALDRNKIIDNVNYKVVDVHQPFFNALFNTLRDHHHAINFKSSNTTRSD